MTEQDSTRTDQVQVGRRETVAHIDVECTWEGATETVAPEEARGKGYSACLMCLPEGWPDA